jgi:hypothetical protein
MDYHRWYGTVTELPPGHYRRAVRPDGTHGATICCHACGKRYTLNTGHGIHADGNISPSVVCPHENCAQNGAAHVAIRLLP